MSERVPLLEVGKLLAGLEDLKAKKGEPPWSDPVVLTDDIQAFIICHAPGHPNDTHYHLHDEWWVVLQGEIDWYIEDEPAQRLAILDHDEVPGLEIHCASRQTPRLDNLADDGFGHGSVQVAANRQQRTDSLEGFHHR